MRHEIEHSSDDADEHHSDDTTVEPVNHTPPTGEPGAEPPHEPVAAARKHDHGEHASISKLSLTELRNAVDDKSNPLHDAATAYSKVMVGSAVESINAHAARLLAPQLAAIVGPLNTKILDSLPDMSKLTGGIETSALEAILGTVNIPEVSHLLPSITENYAAAIAALGSANPILGSPPILPLHDEDLSEMHAEIVRLHELKELDFLDSKEEEATYRATMLLHAEATARAVKAALAVARLSHASSNKALRMSHWALWIAVTGILVGAGISIWLHFGAG